MYIYYVYKLYNGAQRIVDKSTAVDVAVYTVCKHEHTLGIYFGGIMYMSGYNGCIMDCVCWDLLMRTPQVPPKVVLNVCVNIDIDVLIQPTVSVQRSHHTKDCNSNNEDNSFDSEVLPV